MALRDTLTGIQRGTFADTHGWMARLGPSGSPAPTAATVVVTSIAAPSTSPVIPPNRRTQCATSTAAQRERDQHDDRTLPRPRTGQHRHRRDRDDPRRDHRQRLGARDRRAQRAALRGGHRRGGTPRPRRPGPPSPRRSPPTAPQFGERQALHHDRHDHRGHTERARRPVAHHLQRPLRRPVAAERRRRCRPARRCAGRGCAISSAATASTPASGLPRAERLRRRPHHRGGQRARARRRRPAARSARPGRRRSGARTGSTVANANAPATERITHRSDRWPRRTWPSTPVWRPRRARSAARPRRRCPRRAASAGRRSAPVRAAAAPACAPVRWTGGPPATTAGRRAPAVGDQRRGGHHHAVEQHRRAAHGGLSAEPRHRRQIRAAAHPQQPDRIGRQRRGRGTARRGSPPSCATQPASSMPVPRPTTATGSVPVSAAIKVVAAVVFPIPMSPAISRSAPASTSSSAIRRPASIAACASSARQRVLDGDVAAAAAHLVRADRRRTAARRQSTAMSTTRTRRPGELGEHVDRRAAGVEVRDHLRGDLRAGTPTRPAAVTPWSPANTTTRGRSNCRGGHTPWQAATHTDRSSSRPSEPGGLVNVSWRARAAAATSASGAAIVREVAVTSSVSFTVTGWPATTSTTRSHTSASRWLSAPSSSANRRPDCRRGHHRQAHLRADQHQRSAETRRRRRAGRRRRRQPSRRSHASRRSIAAVSQPPMSSTSVGSRRSARNCVATSAVSTVDQCAGRRARWAATRADHSASSSATGPVASSAPAPSAPADSRDRRTRPTATCPTGYRRAPACAPVTQATLSPRLTCGRGARIRRSWEARLAA